MSFPVAISRYPVINDYCDYAKLEGKAESTIYCRHKSLERLQAVLPVPLIEATPTMLLAWRAGIRLSDQSIANYVADARQFFEWARAVAGLRDDNPAARLPVPHLGRRLPRPIPADQLVTAVVNAPPDIRAWLALAAFAGLRAKEIAYLRRENVLDQAETPSVFIAADATKGKKERMVKLHPVVLRELRAAGLPSSGWVFPRLDGKPGPNAPYTISRRANRHLREHDIPATLHMGRHYFGTWLYTVEKDLLAVAEAMGHSNLNSTRGYALVSQERIARQIDALPIPAVLQLAA